MKTIVVKSEVKLDQGKETVRVSFEIPLPPLLQEGKAGLLFQKIIKEIYQPVADNLSNFLAALQLSGKLGVKIGVPVLARHLKKATEEMIEVLRVAEERENNPPPFFPSNN